MRAYQGDRDRLFRVLRDVVTELEPKETAYVELTGAAIVSALLAGEDVRRTFNKGRITGDFGAAGQAAVGVVKSLTIAWITHKVYRTIGNQPPPILPAVHESLIAELVREGYSPWYAGKVATAARDALARAVK